MSSDEELLQQLGELRLERGERKKCEELVIELVRRGIYPSEPTPLMKKQGLDVLHMVNYYGVNWHKWTEPVTCPKCNADLRDHAHGPPFGRQLGIYSVEKDRTMSWCCPDCSHRWDRK